MHKKWRSKGRVEDEYRNIRAEDRNPGKEMCCGTWQQENEKTKWEKGKAENTTGMKVRSYNIMEKGKWWSEIKRRKIGRRKRLRKEYLKVQKPQNHIHRTEHRMLSHTPEKICNTKNTNICMLASCSHNMQYRDGCHPVVMSEQTNTQTLSDTTIHLIATQLHYFGLLHNYC
jgi:hypothetical protein